MLALSTLKYFGLTGKGQFSSDITQMYAAELRSAIEANQLVAVVAPFGMGKTELVRSALRSVANSPSGLDVVEVHDPLRERQTVAVVMNAVIFELGDSNPRRDAEARARQFIRLVGQRVVVDHRRVCVVIENAHRLHPSTLMAIKDIRERSFAGVSPLFSVLLVGQPGLDERLSKHQEVLYRTNVIKLDSAGGWMGVEERVAYLEAVYGPALTPAVRGRIALLANGPLALDYTVEEAMRRAHRMGFNVLDDRTVMPSVTDLFEASGLTQGQAAKLLDIPKSTIGDILRDGDTHSRASDLRSRLAALATTGDGASGSLALHA